jgi:hypothetical protein
VASDSPASSAALIALVLCASNNIAAEGTDSCAYGSSANAFSNQATGGSSAQGSDGRSRARAGSARARDQRGTYHQSTKREISHYLYMFTQSVLQHKWQAGALEFNWAFEAIPLTTSRCAVILTPL